MKSSMTSVFCFGTTYNMYGLCCSVQNKMKKKIKMACSLGKQQINFGMVSVLDTYTCQYLETPAHQKLLLLGVLLLKVHDYTYLSQIYTKYLILYIQQRRILDATAEKATVSIRSYTKASTYQCLSCSYQ